MASKHLSLPTERVFLVHIKHITKESEKICIHSFYLPRYILSLQSDLINKLFTSVCSRLPLSYSLIIFIHYLTPYIYLWAKYSRSGWRKVSFVLFLLSKTLFTLFVNFIYYFKLFLSVQCFSFQYQNQSKTSHPKINNKQFCLIRAWIIRQQKNLLFFMFKALPLYCFPELYCTAHKTFLTKVFFF